MHTQRRPAQSPTPIAGPAYGSPVSGALSPNPNQPYNYATAREQVADWPTPEALKAAKDRAHGIEGAFDAESVQNAQAQQRSLNPEMNQTRPALPPSSRLVYADAPPTLPRVAEPVTEETFDAMATRFGRTGVSMLPQGYAYLLHARLRNDTALTEAGQFFFNGEGYCVAQAGIASYLASKFPRDFGVYTPSPEQAPPTLVSDEDDKATPTLSGEPAREQSDVPAYFQKYADVPFETPEERDEAYGHALVLLKSLAQGRPDALIAYMYEAERERLARLGISVPSDVQALIDKAKPRKSEASDAPKAPKTEESEASQVKAAVKPSKPSKRPKRPSSAKPKA